MERGFDTVHRQCHQPAGHVCQRRGGTFSRQRVGNAFAARCCRQGPHSSSGCHFHKGGCSSFFDRCVGPACSHVDFTWEDQGRFGCLHKRHGVSCSGSWSELHDRFKGEIHYL